RRSRPSPTSAGRNPRLDPAHHATPRYRLEFPKTFFLARCAPPSAQPGPRPWSAPSSLRNRSASASPPLGGGDALETEKRRLRSRTVPSASGRTPLAAGPVLHTALRPAPCPQDDASESQPSHLRCNASVPSSYVRSAILTDERFLHFQLRQDMCATHCS